MKKISLVIPSYNEEECVELFYSSATKFFRDLNKYDYELIFINDGSIDKTKEILHKLASQDQRVKVVHMSRNFGPIAGMNCGFKLATGDAVAEIDCDLQDPIETLKPMLEKWEEGYQVVHAVRKKRKGENWFKKLSAKMYYWIFNMLSKTKIQADSGEFKLYDRKVIDVLNSITEKDKYFRFITSWVGFKQCNVEFVRNERVAGKTKWTTKKLFRLAGNTIVANSTAPLYLSFKVGIWTGLLSLATFITFIVLAICGTVLPITAWIFPFVATLFSMEFVLKGVSNAYIDKIYMECKHRPDYIIDETENI